MEQTVQQTLDSNPGFWTPDPGACMPLAPALQPLLREPSCQLCSGLSCSLSPASAAILNSTWGLVSKAQEMSLLKHGADQLPHLGLHLPALWGARPPP